MYSAQIVIFWLCCERGPYPLLGAKKWSKLGRNFENLVEISKRFENLTIGDFRDGQGDGQVYASDPSIDT